jgi:hypothetical protein
LDRQCNIVFADPINHLGVVLLKDSLKLMHTVFDMFDCFDAIWRYVDENNIIQELFWVKDRFSLPGWCNLSEKGFFLFFNKGSEPFTNNNFLSMKVTTYFGQLSALPSQLSSSVGFLLLSRSVFSSHAYCSPFLKIAY